LEKSLTLFLQAKDFHGEEPPSIFSATKTVWRRTHQLSLSHYIGLLSPKWIGEVYHAIYSEPEDCKSPSLLSPPRVFPENYTGCFYSWHINILTFSLLNTFHHKNLVRLN